MMKYEIVTLKEKRVAALAARTSNTDPEMGRIIGGLWNCLYGEGIYSAISGKVNTKALGIYTDYAGDEKGEYTVLAGCEVAPAVGQEAWEEGQGSRADRQEAETAEQDSAKNQLVYRTIPAGRYAKFIVRGDMQKAVSEGWQQIWQMDLPRAFTYDFEEYQDDSMENAEIHLYIALKDEEE